MFWVGLQTLTAILALIGLAFYTKYTRMMMETAELGRRASSLPSLVIQQDVLERGIRRIQIMNAGMGPALNVRFWAQKVSPEFELNGDIFVRRPAIEELFLGTILSQKTVEVGDPHYSRNDKILYVAECDDLAGGGAQMQLLAWPDSAQRQALLIQKVMPKGLPDSKLPLFLRKAIRATKRRFRR